MHPVLRECLNTVLLLWFPSCLRGGALRQRPVLSLGLLCCRYPSLFICSIVSWILLLTWLNISSVADYLQFFPVTSETFIPSNIHNKHCSTYSFLFLFSLFLTWVKGPRTEGVKKRFRLGSPPLEGLDLICFVRIVDLCRNLAFPLKVNASYHIFNGTWADLFF